MLEEKGNNRDFAGEASQLREKILGFRYKDKHFGNLDVAAIPEVQEKIKSFMKKRKNFLIWCGNPGLGKTHFCGAFFEWALRNFRFFRYFKEKNLQEDLRKIMIEYGWDTHREIERMFDCDLVFLDDVGKLGHTNHKEDMLFDIIDVRYNSMLPTIITTNLSMKEFRSIYEPRLCSRLFANENIIIEIMDGPDYRDIEK